MGSIADNVPEYLLLVVFPLQQLFSQQVQRDGSCIHIGGSCVGVTNGEGAPAEAFADPNAGTGDARGAVFNKIFPC